MGYVVRGPLAGPTWHHLQYVKGLAELGHDVWYLEDSDEWAGCYNPQKQEFGADPRYGLAYIQRVFGRLGLGNRWAYHDALDPAGPRWHGPAAERMRAICASADVVLNVSGINPLRPWLMDIAHRVLIDTDPVFTQVDILNDPARRAFAEAHNAFFSFGESIGLPGCRVPDDGLPWRPTRQPVLLDAWRPTPGPEDGRFTTVMMWDSYDAREWRGERYGMKSQEMERVLAMPSRCGARFEVALGGPTAPHDRLSVLGWHVADPLAVTCDPWDYQRYIAASKAEFGVAKHGYVTSACGWFSERSVSYLALGRPVIVQETGFSRHLPTGDGLLAFETLDEAVSAVGAVDAHYRRHARAARDLVEAHFDARRVLARLLDEVLDGPAPPDPPRHPETCEDGDRG
jgi:hypothetical protein